MSPIIFQINIKKKKFYLNNNETTQEITYVEDVSSAIQIAIKKSKKTIPYQILILVLESKLK